MERNQGHLNYAGCFVVRKYQSSDSNRLLSSVAFVLVLLVAIPRVIICLCHPYKMNYLLFAYLLPRDLYSWCSDRIFSALMWVFVILSGHDSFLDALN